jgi:transposase-like protein
MITGMRYPASVKDRILAQIETSDLAGQLSIMAKHSITPRELKEWRRAFAERGQEGLKVRVIAEARPKNDTVGLSQWWARHTSNLLRATTAKELTTCDAD